MTSPIRTVKLTREAGLWAIYGVLPGQPDLYLAGLLTEESRALYLSWHPEWTVKASETVPSPRPAGAPTR